MLVNELLAVKIRMFMLLNWYNNIKIQYEVGVSEL